MGGYDKGRANYSDQGGGAWMSQGWVSLVISKLTGEMTGPWLKLYEWRHK